LAFCNTSEVKDFGIWNVLFLQKRIGQTQYLFKLHSLLQLGIKLIFGD
jgi:hypothetical protein